MILSCFPHCSILMLALFIDDLVLFLSIEYGEVDSHGTHSTNGQWADVSTPGPSYYHGLTHCRPRRFEWNFRYNFRCNFQTDFSVWWLGHLLWNCPNMNVTGLHLWSVNIGSGNGLVLTVNVDPDISRHMVSLGHNELTLIRAWLINYIHYDVWDEITYPFQNFSSCTAHVWKWLINFIPHFTRIVIAYP